METPDMNQKSGETGTHKKGLASLYKLTVTQFISFGFYATPFAVFALKYDIRSGIGWITVPENMNTALQWIWYIGIVWGLVFANGVRFYLSNWAVEEDKFFIGIKEKAPQAWWTIGEWWLRMVSLVCVYIIPISLASKGFIIEVALLGSFISLYWWDTVVAAQIAKSGALPTIWKVLEEGFSKRKLEHFHQKVVFWRFFEFFGLVASVLYIFSALLSNVSPEIFTYVLAIINAYFLLLFFVEFYINSKGDYPSLLGWSTCLGILLYFLRHIFV